MLSRDDRSTVPASRYAADRAVRAVRDRRERRVGPRDEVLRIELRELLRAVVPIDVVGQRARRPLEDGDERLLLERCHDRVALISAAVVHGIEEVYDRPPRTVAPVSGGQ